MRWNNGGRPSVTNEEMLADIHRVYKKTGMCDSKTYEFHGKHAASTIWSRFGSWPYFLYSAGLKEARKTQPRRLPLKRRPRPGHYQNKADSDAQGGRHKFEHPQTPPRGWQRCLRCDKKFLTKPSHWFVCPQCTVTDDWSEGHPVAV